MDSQISSPMTVVQDTDPATTVTIHTEPSPDVIVDGSTGGQGSSNDWLLAATNSIQITANQITDGVGGPDTHDQVIGVQAGDWFSKIRGARFHNNGKSIIGYVDTSNELQTILQEYQTITGTSFPAIQQLNLTTKASEEEYLQQRFLTPSARPRLFWQMHAGEPVIHFDGVPFITVGHCTDVPCILAGKRKSTTQLLVATGDVLPTKVHTHGCTAKISIRRILRYPSSRLPDTGIQGITVMRRLRKQVLEVLTAKICAGLAKPTERYYFSLPTPLAHDIHIVPEVEDPPSLIEPVHDEILNQITQSITSVSHIHDHIRKYVKKTYGGNPAINIDDPTFNPSRYDLSRYIYWLYKSGRAIDQDCPFRERYSILNEVEDERPLSFPSTNPSPTEDTLSTMYNIIVPESGDITQLEFTTPHIGAEETTSTMTPITLTTKTPPPTSQRNLKRAGSSPSTLLAIPKSNVFTSNTSELQSLDITSIQQAQEEVHSMLTILENQMYACRDLNALQILRRQLTTLCTEFSVHLAGQKRHNVTPSQSDDNKRVHLEH